MLTTPISVRVIFNIITSTHTYALASTDHFSGNFQTKILYVFLISAICISCSLMSSVLLNHADGKPSINVLLFSSKSHPIALRLMVKLPAVR